MLDNPDWFSNGPVSPAEIASISGRVDLTVLNQKKILITGAQGLIGNYLAQAISEVMAHQGTAPSTLFLQSRRQLAPAQAWASRYKFIEHLSMHLNFSEVFPSVDVIIHAASPASPSKYDSPESIYIPNISGVVSALALSPAPERILFISSGEVYGLHEETLRSSDINPRFQASGTRASYPNAKLVAEKIIIDASVPDSKFNVARLFHTFGPGLSESDGRSFADFLHNAARGTPLRLYSDGADLRNFAYIEDSIAGLLEILVSDSSGQVFDVGGQSRVSIKAFADIVAGLSGVDVVIEDTAMQGLRTPVCGHTPTPSTQTLTALGWYPQISLADGVNRTLEFIRATIGNR